MKIRIGTRGSKLARWQSTWVQTELERRHPGLEVEVQIIKTTGDKIQDVPLAQIGDTGLFTKAIEDALLSTEVDIAVHSLKDVATEMDPRLKIGIVSKRHSPEDALVCKLGHTLENLPQGATIATSSLRRRSQLWNMRPDLNIVDMRGNLDTRLKKLNESEDVDAVIVARAGLERLGYGEMKKELLAKVNEFFAPMRERREGFAKRPDDVRDILLAGAERARAMAAPVLASCREAAGLGAAH